MYALDSSAQTKTKKTKKTITKKSTTATPTSTSDRSGASTTSPGTPTPTPTPTTENGTGRTPSTPSTTTTTTNSTQPSNQLMADGLKSALEVGFSNASDRLGSLDGFFGNAMIKILFPPEAKQVETTLRSIGMGKVCDDFLLSVNRAAEASAKEAKPIFLSAIKQMSIMDAVNIVTGGDDAATQYLRKTVGVSLQQRFQPLVQSNLDKVDATKYWGSAMTAYNAIPFGTQKINTNLSEYVTTKAIDGLFLVLAEEERKIRKDPISRTTQIIKDVFGWSDILKKGR